MKHCSKCKVEKEVSNFRKHPLTKDRLQSRCKECESKHFKVKYSSDPVFKARCNKNSNKNNKNRSKKYSRNAALKKRYGITVQEYDLLAKTQNNLCAICKQTCKTGNNLAVDHDHNSNHIRGLLCMNCNKGLGHFQDNIELLENAISYVYKARCKRTTNQ